MFCETTVNRAVTCVRDQALSCHESIVVLCHAKGYAMVFTRKFVWASHVAPTNAAVLLVSCCRTLVLMPTADEIGYL